MIAGSTQIVKEMELLSSSTAETSAYVKEMAVGANHIIECVEKEISIQDLSKELCSNNFVVINSLHKGFLLYFTTFLELCGVYMRNFIVLSEVCCSLNIVSLL